jgi:pyruvate,water dikinase
MSATTKNTTLTFTAPGPGPWVLDGTHITRPATRIFQETFPDAIKQGLGACLAAYGSSIDFVEFGFSNGFGYLRPRAVGAPAGATKPPPGLVLKLLFALHPTIKRRRKIARTVFADKPWRGDLDRWDREVKPQAIASHRRLQSVALGTLDDAALAAHVFACLEHARKMIVQHHQFDAPAMLPVGDFLAHAVDWTKRSPGELLQLMRGASPESAGESSELASIRTAILGDPAARAILENTALAPATVVAQLEAHQGPAGAALREYFDLFSYRLSDGIEPGGPCLREVPELLVIRLRALLDPPRQADAGRAAAALDAMRRAVPENHRAEFDALLAEARHTTRLRDERGLYSDIWAWGIYRTAVLAAGERLVKRGRIARASDLLEAGAAELRELLTTSTGGPSAGELSERAQFRSQHTLSEAPPFITAPVGPPPLDKLPADIRRTERAISGYLDCIFQDCADEPTTVATVKGLAVSPGRYVGTARVISGPEELARIQKGDILVTSATSAAFNMALPLLGAILTDRGGTLSHAAIVAREFGIPAVVGCREATHKITNGARIEVDGERGEARVL